MTLQLTAEQRAKIAEVYADTTVEITPARPSIEWCADVQVWPTSNAPGHNIALVIDRMGGVMESWEL